MNYVVQYKGARADNLELRSTTNPVRVCARIGVQGRRRRMLVVMVKILPGHTKKEIDAFFDSVIVK